MKAMYSSTKYYDTYTEVLNYIVSAERDAKAFNIHLVIGVSIIEEKSYYNFWQTNVSLKYKLEIKAYDFRG